MSWTSLKMWCIAWWHSGRDDEDDDDEVGGPEASSRTAPGFDETLTPVSAETPFTSTVSKCPSLSGVIQTSASNLDRVSSIGGDQQQEYTSRSQTSGELAIRNVPADSVRVFLPFFSPQKESIFFSY